MPKPVSNGIVRLVSVAMLLLMALGSAASAREAQLSAGEVSITKEVSGLKGAWGFGFLPSGDLIISEKRGRLYLAQPGESLRRVQGLPDIHVEGQGGLLDVVPARDFVQSNEIFFTFTRAQARGSGTALAVAKIDTDTAELSDVRILFEMTPGSSGGRHYGSRVAEAADGTLFVTIGDRGDRPSAQDRTRHNGSVIRINRDGSIPRDNPFAAPHAPEIWSFGHRNPQGLDIASDGTIWAVEHGPKGGDEVNLIRKGLNYGWPVISYGTHYTGGTVGEGTAKPGLEQPEHYWDPSIAPSGLMVYEGQMFPEWQGDIFVGSLKFDYIARLSGRNLREVEQIELPETLRVRDIREAPDGSIWFISEDRKVIYRISH